MRGAPVGAIVRLHVAWGQTPAPDTFLVTPAGSAYHVLRATPRSLVCRKLSGPDAIPHDAEVQEWEWVHRRRKGKR